MTESIIKYNNDQTSAISAPDKRIIVVAGPGSGKTHTLIGRILHLLQHNTPASNILAVTFTNKAAREIYKRINTQATLAHDTLKVCTFHGLCYELVSNHTAILDLPKKINIISEKNKISLVKNTAKRHNISPKTLLLAITQAKSDENSVPSVAVQDYEKSLALSGFIDLDDLQLLAVKLLKLNPDIKTRYQNLFQHILVDEFQDTSPIQIELLKQLTAPETNLFVIGDPDQSIYSFRGGSSKGFKEFNSLFGIPASIRLKHNYRSTRDITNIAEAVLKGIKDNNLKSQNDPVKLVIFENHKQEINWIIKTIRSLLGGTDMTNTDNSAAKTYSASEIGIIYRLNNMGRILEKRLKDSDIPFTRIKNKNTYDFSDAQKIIEAVKTLKFEGKLSSAIKTLVPDEHANTRLESLMNFAVAYDDLPPGEAVANFLSAIETARTSANQNQADAVTLLTAHSAKGLEFSVVFLIGVEDDLFPFLKINEDELDKKIEEEKKLLYVALTRAKEKLFLTHAHIRVLHGKLYETKLSRFLISVPENCLEKIIFSKKKKQPSPQLRLF